MRKCERRQRCRAGSQLHLRRPRPTPAATGATGRLELRLFSDDGEWWRRVSWQLQQRRHQPTLAAQQVQHTPLRSRCSSRPSGERVAAGVRCGSLPTLHSCAVSHHQRQQQPIPAHTLLVGTLLAARGSTATAQIKRLAQVLRAPAAGWCVQAVDNQRLVHARAGSLSSPAAPAAGRATIARQLSAGHAARVGHIDAQRSDSRTGTFTHPSSGLLLAGQMLMP